MANMSAQGRTPGEMQIKHRGVLCEMQCYTLNKQEPAGNFTLLIILIKSLDRGRLRAPSLRPG